MSSPILLYDGVCGLCNRSVQFILRRDPEGIFRFASLQSALAGDILARHGADARDLDTVYVVINYEEPAESLLARSDAVVFVLHQLRGIWQPAGSILRAIPRRLREALYRLVARNRYRVFGRYETCPLPSEDTRGRFLDL